MSLARPFVLSLLIATSLAGAVMAAPSAEPSDLRRRLTESGDTLKIAGRTLDLGALRAFYESRGFQLAWGGAGEAAGDRLTADLQTVAIDHGLPVEPYAIPTATSDIDHDLLLSDAAVRLGHDIAAGRLPPSPTFGGLGAGTRPAFEPGRFLTQAAAGTPLPQLAEGLQPRAAAYQALEKALVRYRDIVRAGGWRQIPAGPAVKPGQEDDRMPLVRARLIASGELEAGQDKGHRLDPKVSRALERFQEHHGIEPDGALGKPTLAALNVTAEERLQQIIVNLERWRWQPRTPEAVYIAVNIPNQTLDLIENGQSTLSMRVVVGEPKHQTPGMMTKMTAVIVNPTWTIPPSIAAKEILPKLRQDPNYLVANNMRILDAFPENSPQASGIGVDWKKMRRFPYKLRQKPGPDNALGLVKFNLITDDAIYLHDTPLRAFFKHGYRALSHGCVRVERPVELAEHILGGPWTGKVGQAIADATTKTLKLNQPLPVYMQYWTAWADPDGTVHFRDDIYGHDGRMAAAMNRRPRQAPGQMAQDDRKTRL